MNPNDLKKQPTYTLDQFIDDLRMMLIIMFGVLAALVAAQALAGVGK